MSLHDRMAQKAVNMGKKSSEFSNAAQKHANATFLLLIGAVAIWYFWKWTWALIPIAIGAFTAFQSISSTMISTRLKDKEQASEFPGPNFFRIIQEYGKILETSSLDLGAVADAGQLPYSKQQIKDAIVTALRTTSDQQMKEHLKVAYIQLSIWQEGAGEYNEGIDLTSLNKDQDTESLAKAFLEQSSLSGKWAAIVQKEQEDLKRELKEMGLW